jgi:hypothetical protein
MYVPEEKKDYFVSLDNQSANEKLTLQIDKNSEKNIVTKIFAIKLKEVKI